ncbi:aminopeptidase P family protein [Campylobacter peloridis]|uniref:aminopeptidase P family protein n=1 Tax=Campylobacter peloridis TaxID=488546 RepID=UPI001C72C393|nr:aminopeptidase P family protein [Campylobacter peloridis]MBX1886796.1 aminopeptidase P family protein [Campylobacter peloridis]
MNFILKNENALFYECGYSCDNALFLKLEDEAFFITDARYSFEASEMIKNARVILAQDLFASARELLEKTGVDKVCFDPKEFSHFEFKELGKNVNVVFEEKLDFSKNKRIVKNTKELQLLQKAVNFGKECFEEFAKFISQEGYGKSERELHFKVCEIFQKKGELGLSFSPIIAINENAAKAHALPSDKKLEYGDLLLVDAGVVYQRYCSDRTRTACFNESGIVFDKNNPSFKNKEIKEIYEVVKQAQLKAIEKAKIGMKAKELDFIAREVIKNAGFEKEFIHSLGHGVGLDIHELPNISQRSDYELKEGMVFTIEPGIYIKDKLGIRIEDMIYLSKEKAVVL